MWILTLIAIIASLTGYASMTSQIALTDVADAARVTSLATNMASYRAGVAKYAHDNPAYIGAVTAPSFPTGYAALNPPQWRSAILADGTIIVCSVDVSPPGLIKGIATLAQGSVLAGRANTTTTPGKIEAPGTASADQLAVPNTAAITGFAPITNGAAIWLAHRE